MFRFRSSSARQNFRRCSSPNRFADLDRDLLPSAVRCRHIRAQNKRKVEFSDDRVDNGVRIVKTCCSFKRLVSLVDGSAVSEIHEQTKLQERSSGSDDGSVRSRRKVTGIADALCVTNTFWDISFAIYVSQCFFVKTSRVSSTEAGLFRLPTHVIFTLSHSFQAPRTRLSLAFRLSFRRRNATDANRRRLGDRTKGNCILAA